MAIIGVGTREAGGASAPLILSTMHFMYFNGNVHVYVISLIHVLSVNITFAYSQLQGFPTKNTL